MSLLEALGYGQFGFAGIEDYEFKVPLYWYYSIPRSTCRTAPNPIRML